MIFLETYLGIMILCLLMKLSSFCYSLRRRVIISMAKGVWAITLVASTVFCPAVFAQSFQGLGDLPGGTISSLAMDVSADGKVVVGVSNSGAPQAFRWTLSDGMKPLGFLPGGDNSYAIAVSEDGLHVTGWSNSTNSGSSNVEAFRWTDPGPMVGLGDLVGGQFNSWGEGIAANGGIIVGGGTSTNTEAFLWVFALGMTGLGHLSGGTASGAKDVWFAGAGGAALIVGSSNASGVVNEAFYYLTPGPMVGMGFLPNASSKESDATAISSNGKVIVGWGANATAGAKEAYRYVYPNGPMQGLGFLPPPNPKTKSKALAVSADGSVIVGYASSTDGGAAFFWDASNGMRDLKLVLMEHYGLDLTGWKLETATGISDDGKTIVGGGTNPSGQLEGWIANLTGAPATIPSCFDFNTNTTQNWTIDQIYETSTQTKKTPTLGFVLHNDQNRLAATASPLVIDGTSTASHDIYLESPDLSSTSSWQKIAGYSIDIQRSFTSPCGDPPNTNYAQLQLRVIDTTDNSDHLFAEYNGTNYVFHEIKLGTPYHFVWKPSFLSDAKYKVKKVRIRLTGSGDNIPGECAAKGSWLVDNVCAETGPPPEAITLTSPNGGEKWQVGSAHNITWTSQNLSNPIKIEYSTDGGANYKTVVSSTTNDGSHSWTIPNEPSSNCFVRVSDATDGSPSDASDAKFEIAAAPSLTVTSPNGGENWQVGSSHNITWTSQNFSDPVKIEYSADGGSSYKSVVNSTANDGSYSWSVPNDPSTNCKVRISGAASGNPSDASNVVFTISSAGNTPSGQNVVVDVGNGVKVTFSNVTNPGETSLNIKTSGAPPPSGFKIMPSGLPVYFDINTTASYSGNITICIPYSDTGMSPAEEASLKLNVYEDPPGQWKDITSSVDTQNNIICGTVTHLTDFAVMMPTGSGAPVHFTFTANTGDSYSIVIDAATLDGSSLSNGDEIGVFTPAGLCVGASVWDGTTPLALTAWGDDTQTPGVDGYAAGEKMSFKVWSSSANAEYQATASYSHGNGNFGSSAYAEISKLTAVSSITQTLALAQGWSWISFNVTPEDLSVDKVFSGANNLEIVVNNGGEFYIPSVINNIGQLNILEGYKLYLNSAEQIALTGQPVQANTPIQLSSGWNFISYLPNSSMGAETALNSILSELAIVKDDNGNFFIPGVINNLGDMSAGNGYKLYLNSSATLTYPSSSQTAKRLGQTPVMTGRATQHFIPHTRTGESYSVVIQSIRLDDIQSQIGDEIGIFTESGLCVGAGVWNGSEVIGIAAWADDERSVSLDGYRENERMVFKYWSNDKKAEIPLQPSFRKGNGNFGDGVYASVELTGETTVNSFSLRQNYPNPFNSETLITFELSIDEKVELKIFNLEGKEIRTLINKDMPAGRHQMRWNGLDRFGNSVPSGIYIYSLKTKSFVSVKKATMLK